MNQITPQNKNIFKIINNFWEAKTFIIFVLVVYFSLTNALKNFMEFSF
jgi:hypothetical protein